MKKQNVLKWIILTIAIAINVFIIVNAFINGENSAKESNSIAQGAATVINTIKPDTINSSNFDKFASAFRKGIGHFALFGVSGVFTTLSFYLFVKEKKIGYFLYELLITLAFGFALACLTEFAQKYVPGRVGSWTDVLIDSLGYLTGVLPLFLILLFLKSPIFGFKKVKENRPE